MILLPNFSLNEQPSVNNKNEEVAIGMQEETKVVEKEVQAPQIILENIDTYKVAVSSMREKLVQLVNEGLMTESVASRLLEEFMLNTFNQLVKIGLA